MTALYQSPTLLFPLTIIRDLPIRQPFLATTRLLLGQCGSQFGHSGININSGTGIYIKPGIFSVERRCAEVARNCGVRPCPVCDLSSRCTSQTPNKTTCQTKPLLITTPLAALPAAVGNLTPEAAV